MKAVHMYGIPNCSTVKKARLWLESQGVNYQFHDFKKQGVTREQLAAWAQQLGWETLLNRKGTTWRKLADARKAAINDADAAFTLMIEQPSVIKRPLLQQDHALLIGFDKAEWNQMTQSL